MRLFKAFDTLFKFVVSIHAPLAGCDRFGDGRRPWSVCFNPRTPRGVRPFGAFTYKPDGTFQSTHPSRGATPSDVVCPVRITVSIHAPLAGCDPFASMMMPLRKMFQSTHPSRGATGNLQHVQETIEVSIHAPLAGCDPAAARMLADDRVFQSTHPSRGAAQQQRSAADVESVSIHAPLAGCDKEYERGIERLRVSIHAPLAGCDRGKALPPWSPPRFNPRTPRGVRPARADRIRPPERFQSTHPSRGATPKKESVL